MGKDLGKEKGDPRKKKEREEKEGIRCRQDAVEYAGQEDSAESTCCWARFPVYVRVLSPRVRGPCCLLGGLARG